jgi:uncharacterized protein DUF5954
MASSDDHALEREFRDLMATAHPVSALAEQDALRAIHAFPHLLLVGPMFGVAEWEQRGWRVSALGECTPQGARDALAHQFREYAAAAAVTRTEFLAVARLLDRERHDELTVAGRRFRIIRVEQVIRMSADAPEPPRPTDPDPRHPARGEEAPPPDEFLSLADDTPGFAAAELMCQFRAELPSAETTPAEVRQDALRALSAYPTLRIMAPVFTVAEQIEGGWRSATMPCDTPQRARETLAVYFSQIVPAIEEPSEAEGTEYASAAQRLTYERVDDLTVAGRRFRIVRIEKIARLGADGPEPPRRSDFDPEPPIEA